MYIKKCKYALFNRLWCQIIGCFEWEFKGQPEVYGYFYERRLSDCGLSRPLFDTEAFGWLLKNGYPEFAVLSNAIDNEPNAILWLKKYKLDFLSTFAAACRKEDAAIKWFAERDLRVFILLIRTIHDILLHQSWDSSDIHKRRRS